MKKFLTVLLALSVVFTYSFGTVGSAFANTVSNEDANLIKQATEYAKGQLPAAIEKAYKQVASSDNQYITEAAWKAAASDIAEIYEKMYDEAMTKRLNGENLASNWKEYPTNLDTVADRLYPGTRDAVSFESLCAAFAEDDNEAAVLAAKEQFKLDLADALAIYDKVDIDALYSKTTPTDGKTYYQQAVEAIENSKAVFTDYFIAEDGSVQNLDSKVSTIRDNANALENAVYNGITLGGKTNTKVLKKMYADVPTVVEYYYLDGIKTMDQEAGDNAEIEATTAAIKAQVAKNVAAFLKTNTSTSDKEFADNYSAFYNYLAEQITMLTDAGATKLASDVVAHQNMMSSVKASHADILANVISDIEDLEAWAAKYAAEKDATGALVRDPAEVEKLVEKAKVAEYAGKAGIDVKEAYSIGEAQSDIAAMTTKGDAAKLAFDKEAYKSDLDDELAKILDNYYDLEAAQVKAAYAAAKEKVDAITDPASFTKEKTTIQNDLNKEVAKIKNTNQVNALFTTGAMKTELDAQVKSLTTLIDHKNANAQTYDDQYVLGAGQAETLLRDYYIAHDARTADEMKALTGVVEAVAATLPTNAALTAAKKAADDAIAALPTVGSVTSADKAAFVNAYNLVKAYKDMYKTVNGSEPSYTLPAAKFTALQRAIQYDFTSAYARADKTDKAALKAIAADVAAANEELYETGITGEFVDPTVDALAKIRAEEKAAVIAAINAIPLNVTEADRAVVEKARALYDAYVAEYTDYDDATKGYAAAEFAAYYHDLALAEASLGLNDNTELAVKGTHVKIWSSSGKGYIQIRWDQNDNGVTLDGYEVYRSTKKTTGFSKISTFKVQKQKTYKINMKKGTKYYFKVRGFKEVNGVKVYTHDSITVYRTFR